MLLSIIMIGLGASLGAILRWLLSIALNGLFPSIPPGTLAANLLGAFLIGMALWLFSLLPEIPQAWRLFIVTGFLGGLTTFSTFTAEVGALLQTGRIGMAAMAITLHVGGTLIAFFLGMSACLLFARLFSH